MLNYAIWGPLDLDCWFGLNRYFGPPEAAVIHLLQQSEEFTRDSYHINFFCER